MDKNKETGTWPPRFVTDKKGKQTDLYSRAFLTIRSAEASGSFLFQGRLKKELLQCMEELGLTLEQIPEEEGRDFHNAMNDAYYTARVFQHMPHPEDALKYPREPKQLIHPDSSRHKPKGELFDSLASAMASTAAREPKCPVCGRACTLEEAGYVPQAADKYIGLAKCRQHGTVLCRLHLRASQSGRVALMASTAKATRPNIAYVHTKQYQMQQRLAAGWHFNAEAALLNADRSSVPFEG